MTKGLVSLSYQKLSRERKIAVRSLLPIGSSSPIFTAGETRDCQEAPFLLPTGSSLTTSSVPIGRATPIFTLTVKWQPGGFRVGRPGRTSWAVIEAKIGPLKEVPRVY